MNAVPLDPMSITDRAQLAAGLRALRENSGVTFRELVQRSGGLQGTISGWFSGHHLPIKSSADMFDRVLVELGIGDLDERQRWWDAVGRVRSARGRKQSGRGPAPYKGLESFDASDAEWFFGRGDVVEVLRTRVRAVADGGGGVVVVLGASGSGKSSILRAGLATTYPGLGVRSGISDMLDFAEHSAGESVLIFDQLEELWTHADGDERTRFLSAVQSRIDAGAVAVLGLRADFYSNAIDEPVLTQGLVDNPVVLGRLSPDQLREVIVEPARKAGMTVDDALLRVLLAEMEPSGSVFAHDQGALPMLSHALLGTWQSASGSVMTVDDYVATGGLPGAVQQSAEKVYSSLSDVQQSAARRTFVRLVNIDGDVLTRRRVARAELFRNESTDGDVEAVLEDFTGARLLTVEEETVSVTHEVLLTAWDRLRRWIDDDRQWHLTHRRLTDAAVQWDESGRDVGSVLPVSRLASVRESLAEGDREDDLNAVERDFVAVSEARHRQEVAVDRRRRRTLKGLAASLTVITVLAVSAAALAFSARSEADERRVDAEAALSGQLAFQAERLRGVDPALSVQVALAAYELNPTVVARSALLDASALQAPVRFAGPPGEAMVRTDSSGEVLFTAGADGVVTLRSLTATGRPVLSSIDLGGRGESRVIAIAPFAPILAVGGTSGTSLWEFADPTAPQKLAQLPTPVTALVSFDPRGRWLATGTFRGNATLWDLGDIRAPRELDTLTNPGGVSSVAFSPDGTAIVTGGTGRSIRVWDVMARERPIYDSERDASTYEYRQLAFSPDGRTLVAGTTGREVARWSVDGSGRLLGQASLTGFDDSVTDVAFSRDGERIVGVGADSTLRLWNTGDGELLEALPGGAQLSSVAFGSDDRVLATAGKDGVVRLWPQPGPVLGGHGDTVFINPIDGSGTKLVAGVGVRGPGLRVWDLADPAAAVSGRVPLSGVGNERVDGAAAITSDGRIVAGGLVSGGFQLWDVSDVNDPVLLSGPNPAVRTLVGSLSFDEAGRILAVSPQDSTDVALWDVSDPTDPKPLSVIEVGDNPVVLAISPDGSTLAVPTVGDVVELWNITSPEAPTLRTVLGGFENDVNVAVFSPDGSVLAAGSADNSIRLWDVADPDVPTQLSRIDGLRAAIFSLNFDPAGTRLVAGVDGVSMWVLNIEDPTSPSIYATLTAYGDRVNDADFGADGSVIFGGGPARNIRVWQTDPEVVKERICSSGGMGMTPEEWDRYAPGIEYRVLC